MGCCCGTDTVDDDYQALSQGTDLEAGGGLELQVSLENDNVIDEVLPTIYYVIVGRGPMAVVDHRTLLGSAWGVGRIDGRTILHVGAPNPWPRYLRHGLGQPNHLLSFPGFVHQPSAAGPQNTVDGGLDSQYFGQCISQEFAALEHVETAEEWVALIQSRNAPGVVDVRIRDEEEGGDVVYAAVDARRNDPWPDFQDDDAPYRLCLYDPDTEVARWVYAAAIDICTGPGRPNVYPPTGGDTDESRGARTPPWLRPEAWILVPRWRDRRVLNGVDAIRDEVQWNADERVCVTAGGGVGLNAAEKARNHDCVLDWFGRDALMPIFDNPRNITFLRQPGTELRCEPGRRQDVQIDDEDDLISATKRHRMGRGARLRSTAPVAHSTRISVSLEGGNPCHIRDWWGNRSALDGAGYWQFSVTYGQEVAAANVVASLRYDRLVIPNGQGTRHVGQPHAIANHLGFRAVTKENRLVALETADGLVRILGAACNNYPGFDQGTWDRAGKPAANSPASVMWTFHATLPVSAVPDGFIICGVNTALANDYFLDHPNTNVNTMTYAEIHTIVGDQDLARTIVERRRDNNGYKDLQDLRTVCESNAVELAGFTFAYG